MDTTKKEKFEECYREYSKSIFRFIYFKTNDQELAKDFTSDTFVKFWKILKKGEKVINNRALIYRIAHGIVVDHYRKKTDGKNVSIELVNEYELIQNEDFEAKFSIKQQSEELLDTLKILKKEYRDILLLYYVDEFDVSEISKILDKKQNTVRVLIHRAIRALGKEYEKNRLN